MRSFIKGGAVLLISLVAGPGSVGVVSGGGGGETDSVSRPAVAHRLEPRGLARAEVLKSEDLGAGTVGDLAGRELSGLPPGGNWVQHQLTPGPAEQTFGSASPGPTSGAVSLAASDFDGDGVTDIVYGRIAGDQGTLTIYRGNLDSIYPRHASGGVMSGAGSATPFHPPLHVFKTPVRPDLLAAGDFDNDGHTDVAVAARGSGALVLMPGDGRGRLGEPVVLQLFGAITGIASGEVGRADGLADLAVTIVKPVGAALILLAGPEGAWNSSPDQIALPAPAESVHVRRLDEGPAGAVILVAGREIVLVRDATKAERIPLAEPVQSVAVGSFVGSDGTARIAALLDDGTLQYLQITDGSAEVVGERFEPTAANASGGGSQIWRRLLPYFDPAAGGQSLIVLGESDGAIGGLAMRLNGDGADDLVVLTPESSAPAVYLSGVDAVFTVTNTSDSGAGSLRQAILDANSAAGSDNIDFAIPGVGPHTITLASPLPDVNGPLTLDGTTQSGWSGDPIIVLDGSAAGAGNGLNLVAGSGGSVVRDLVIQGFQGRGVNVLSAGNVIEGCFIGTDATGTLDLGNTGHGVFVDGSDTVVGGTAAAASNLISGNNDTGVFVESGGDSCRIEGNLIGTDKSGSADLGNGNSGIVVFATSTIVGGATAGAGNVVSGNDAYGIGIGEKNGSLVQGNRIGTDLAGTATIANAYSGVFILDSALNTVGGTAVGSRNVISGNSEHGVHLLEDIGGAGGNRIQGNYVGTDATGSVDMGNALSGVYIEDAPDTDLGGTASGAGNLISGNDEFGVLIFLDGANGNEVLGNRIGTDVSGTSALGNTLSGVIVQDASDNTIGGNTETARNVICANGQEGVYILEDAGTSTGNVVMGNFIGVDAGGTSALGNTLSGVFIEAQGNVIGGPGVGDGNVISANDEFGVVVIGGVAAGNRIEGNLIGTDFSGALDLGNFKSGVIIDDASGNTVGGSSSGAGNLISANGHSGVFIVQDIGSASANVIRGNRIGTDLSGESGLGNGFNGVTIRNSQNNAIGGAGAGEGNVVSANEQYGILVIDAGATGNTIRGNLIGTDIDGTDDLGNGLAGIRVEDASDNTLGGAAGEGNVIAFNQGHGVTVVEVAGPAVGNDVLGNSIFRNSLLGIGLGAGGVTLNDALDPDTGPNRLQNYPVLVAAETGGALTRIDGSLNSIPASTFRLEFFSTETCDGSGHGEGEEFLDFTAATTDAAGNRNFSRLVATAVPVGSSVVATATGADGTSEFSACVAVTACTVAAFSQTVQAAGDKASLFWTVPADVFHIRGDLSAVASYAYFDHEASLGATAVDISSDSPGAGAGIYYLVQDAFCGSWQTALGAEPDRDLSLP